MGRRAEGPCPAWGSPGKKSSWQAALLAASILSSCCLLTEAQDFPVTMEPSQPLEGQDVTLTPRESSSFLVCSWFRGEETPTNRIFSYVPSPNPSQSNGSAFTGRETGGPGCSLHIRNLALNYTGNYIVSKTMTDGSMITGRAYIEVLERVSNVTIVSHPEKAIENQPTVLNCSSAGSNVSYIWLKGNQKLTSGDRISLNNSSLIFNPTSRNDSGNYSCYGYNSFSNSSATYWLDVFYGPDDPVISPQGHDYAEGSPLTLHCYADSNPASQYIWYFNESELLRNPEFPISSLSFNHSGNYTCNASNTETNLSSSASWEIKVFEKLSQPILWPAASTVKEHENVTLNCTTSESSSVSVSWLKDGNPIPVKSILSARNRILTVPDISKDDEGMYTCEARNLANSATSNPSKITLENAGSQDNGLSAGQIVGIVIGCLLGAVIIVAVVYFVLKKTSFGMTAQHSSNGNIPSAPGRNQGVTDTKPTAGEEDIQYTTLAFNSNNPSPPGPGPTSPSESGTIYSVIKKK